MFKNAFQSGLVSIFFSCGSKPLELWDTEVKNGHIKRVTDSEVRSIVLEIGGSNVSTTHITCPKGGKTLGITLPYMVMIVKNLKKPFTFEVTVLDQAGARRRFRISNFQSTTQILPLCTTMPINLNDGWNQIQFNLAEFTKRSYKTQFMEVAKLKINANIRLRRVYFTESLLPDDQLPPEYKLCIPPVYSKPTKAKAIVEEVKGKENVKPSPSKLTAVKDEKKGSKVDVVKSSSKEAVRKPSEDKKPQNKDDKLETEDAVKSEPPAESEKPALTEPVSEEQTAIDSDKVETVEPAEPAPESEVAVPNETAEPATEGTEVVPEEAAPAETDATTEEPAATTETAE